MKGKLHEVIYRGIWRGLGKKMDKKVENEYTTIIVKPGQDLKQRARETREKFVGKTWASVLVLWCLGLFCALSAFSQTTIGPLAPTVSFTVPAKAATGVAVNQKIAATFSKAMDPLTITTVTFTSEQGAAAVAGTVTYAGVTATFNPLSTLAPNTTYTATVTTGARDLGGNALASDFVWSFTTGATPNTTPPTVSFTVPPLTATFTGVKPPFTPALATAMVVFTAATADST